MVESQPSKLLVAGSIPVSRSSLRYDEAARLRLGRPTRLSRHRASATRTTENDDCTTENCADVAQLAERVLGKDEVSSSILDIGSILRSRRERRWVGEQGQQTPRWSTERAARRWT